MGTGNKLHPELFKVSDIYSTKKDPIARVLRRELKKRGVDSLKVVYSREEPVKATGGQSLDICLPESESDGNYNRHSIPGSIAFVPSVAGLIMAGEVVKDLIAANVCR